MENNFFSKKSFSLRYKTITVLFVIMSLALFGKFIELQVVRRTELLTLANSQLDIQERTLKAQRGNIYDCNGKVLATDIVSWDLGAYVPQILNLEAFSNEISQCVKIPKKNVIALVEKAQKNKNTFLYLKKQITPDEYSRISAYYGKDPAIVLDKNYKRYYPYGSLISSTIGVTGEDNQGLSGLEFQYDKYLAGIDGKSSYWITGNLPGVPLIDEKVKEPVQGNSLFLSIDINIQFFVQQKMKGANSEYSAERSTCIVMNPKNNSVLAMVSVPDFDPNNWQNIKDLSLTNMNIGVNYEPGSVFKAVTGAIGLETKKINLTEKIKTNGYQKVGGFWVHDTHNYGAINLFDMYRRSSNIGFGTLGLRIGKEDFYNYAKKFGIGSVTGIDLPGEEKGILLPTSQWSGPTLITSAFGQGLAITAIQLANYYTALARRGIEGTPYVVQRIIDSNKNVVYEAPTPDKNGKRIMSETTANTILEALDYTVDPDGIYTADIKGYNIGGKTGTAEIPAKNGGYIPGKYVFSFAGIITVDDPSAVVFLSIHRTAEVRTSFLTSAPTFKKIAIDLINYMHIPPSK